jgi:hypothetical protein
MVFIVDRILKVMGTTIVTTQTQSLRDPTTCIPNGADHKHVTDRTKDSGDTKFWSQIVWRNVIAFLYMHSAALYGLYLAVTKMKGITVLWGKYFHSTALDSTFWVYFM